MERKVNSRKISLEPLGEIIFAQCFRLSLTLQSSSASSTTNTQIELPDDTTRSDQANSKKMIRACVDKIIEKRRPRDKYRLSDEELVLHALTCCSNEWLLTSESDEVAFKSIPSSYNQHESFRDVLKEDHQSTSQQDYPEPLIQNQVQTI